MAEQQKSLEQTPTWAVATVCTVFVVASLLVERGIHILGTYLKRTKQKELGHTLDKIKDELMLLGFISLFLTVFQPKVASLCMPERLNTFMLPCKYKPSVEGVSPSPAAAAAHGRRLFEAAVAASPGSCSPGHVQIISTEGLHQLHLFIFVMAVIHVLYSGFTVLIGLWIVHSWKKWEVETHQENYDCVHEAIMATHKIAGIEFVSGRTSYKFLHTSWTGLNLDSYLYSFFRQFGKPIQKADYLVLRLGFITNHRLSHKYDFHSYIRRTMEDEFKIVVGISAYLWAFVCIFLLVNIYEWYTYFWIAFIPTIMILLVGMKLQQVITDLALEVRGGVQKIETSSLQKSGGKQASDKPGGEYICKPIQPGDNLFWFHSPGLLLYLVHFILFQNAFELAFFFWTLFTYGFSSCLVGRTWMVIVRLLVGVFVQVLCSATTLPLYALVTQLGSNIKFSVFNEATALAIHGWREKAKQTHNAKGHVHQPLTLLESHSGVVSVDKDEHGHSIQVDRPHANGTKPHHGHEDGVHEHHAHPDPHSRPQGGTHTVEIMQQASAACDHEAAEKAQAAYRDGRGES